MLPALRFFRHQDGSLARFNGMGATIHDRIAAILRHDDTAGAPLLHAPHSGYERLSIGGTTVIADTGLPPPTEVSGRAHAGCLSFEMSSGRHNFIVNAGIDTFGAPDFRPLARATAAHSTATLNDTSSARFNSLDRRQRAARRAAGGRPEACALRAPATQGRRKASSPCMTAMSRASASITSARCRCRDGGNVLAGIDRFFLAGGKTARNNGRDFVAVRFHVHPDINLFSDEEDRLVLTANGHRRLGVHALRGRADGRGFDLLRRPERPAQVAADRARLQGLGSAGSALADDQAHQGLPTAQAV